jgi:nitric oxide reductase large subunit
LCWLIGRRCPEQITDPPPPGALPARSIIELMPKGENFGSRLRATGTAIIDRFVGDRQQFWVYGRYNWLGIAGFFSALEPMPLLGMVVHAVYDAGVHRMKTSNRPAFYWTLAEAFGNFLGGGVFGFMITLPQLNLFAHGTQWTVSHGHFAFWGAYACGVLSVCYIALQEQRRLVTVNGTGWVWAFALLNAGLIGMVGSLLARDRASVL